MIRIERCYCCKKASPNLNKISLLVEFPGSRDNIDFIFCSNDCKKEIEKLVSFNNKHISKFYILGGLVLFLAVMLTFISALYPDLSKPVQAIFMILLGVLALIYPYATWMTYQLIGIRNTKMLVRILGIILIYGGIRLW